MISNTHKCFTKDALTSITVFYPWMHYDQLVCVENVAYTLRRELSLGAADAPPQGDSRAPAPPRSGSPRPRPSPPRASPRHPGRLTAARAVPTPGLTVRPR